MKTKLRTLLAASLPLTCVATAYAHPGHSEIGFQAWIAHPATGLDHVIAGLVIGFLAMRIGGSANWKLPLLFLSAVVLGAVCFGSSMTPTWLRESPAFLTCLLGIFLVHSVRIASPSGRVSSGALLLTTALGLALGCSHNGFLQGTAIAYSQFAGMLLGMTALIAIGAVTSFATLRDRQHAWSPVAGAAILAIGLLSCFGVI